MTKPKFGTINSNLEPVPYQGNILGEYHQRGQANGWKAAQSSPATPRKPDTTITTHRVAVSVTKTTSAIVVIEVTNITEQEAGAEARHLLQRHPELLEDVSWSEPRLQVVWSEPARTNDEPVARLCMREEYARRRDLHKNAVRIPLEFGKEGK